MSDLFGDADLFDVFDTPAVATSSSSSSAATSTAFASETVGQKRTSSAAAADVTPSTGAAAGAATEFAESLSKKYKSTVSTKWSDASVLPYDRELSFVSP
jgi:hypothetical protein